VRIIEAETRVGSIVDERFELVALAASGGMGHVYRAHELSSGRLVALKVLVADYTDTPRFTREAEILARIDHPGVVRYVAHGALSTGEKYIVMEWLSGSDLSARLGAGVLGAKDTLTVAACAADALIASHARGIIHRDLKPSNLFVVDDRLTDVKLVDFGIARALSSGDATVTAELVGTPAYMAPEQVRGGAIDRRVDVYGLGAVMYRCLVGEAPFGGSQEIAVLAKILLEPARSVRERVPDVPAAVDELVCRMLAKEPSERPDTMADVARELRALMESNDAGGPRVATAITAREQRVASVVLCANSAAGAATIPEHAAVREETRLRRAVAERGGDLDTLARGALLVTVPSSASPAEQTARAARCALVMHKLRPLAPIVVATGKIVVQGERHVGEVIDRAADALFERPAAGAANAVRVDAATAELLEGRFRIEGDGSWRVLVGEDDAVTPTRTLLGKPARCLGRDHQLAMLGATLAACRSEPRACAALVSAPPGLGKTRLVHELLRTAVPTMDDVMVMTANADATRAASPFAVASQLVLRAAGARDADEDANAKEKLARLVAKDFSGDEAARVTDLLGEIAGMPTPQANASPALRAARADLSVMADALADAFVDWLRAVTARTTVLVVVEDLHWADAASVRLLETAFAALENAPLFILATARPEGVAHLSARFRERGLVEIVLGPLSAQASEKLVRAALGTQATDDLVRALVRRASGHPFHLEELIRAASSGRGADALPDSVLGMVQARLDELDARERRLLRAASVFGDRFWPGAVASLLGDDVSSTDVRAWLYGLTEQEVVTAERTSTWAGEPEYRFRHALLRDAAYATLAEQDRVVAHARAAAWLEQRGESDSALLAEHYVRGEAREQALTHSLRAAAAALHKNELDEALKHTARAQSLGPSQAQLGALRGIEAEVSYWRGDIRVASEHAFEAFRALEASTPPWFDAVAVAIGALGQSGRNDDVASWLERVARAKSAADSRSAHVVALCRGITQLVWAHHESDFRPASEALDTIVARGDLGAFESGWVHRARGESTWVTKGDAGEAAREMQASIEAFERAHAFRALCLTRINAASLAGWSGDSVLATALLEKSRAEAERLGAAFLLRYGRAVEGLVLAFAGDQRAEQAMRAATTGVQASPRLLAICHLVVGSLSLARGDLDGAQSCADGAMPLDVVPDIKCSVLALASRIALARGDAERACTLAEEAARIERERPDFELMTGLAGLALAESRAHAGRREEAKEAITFSVKRLESVARTLPSDEARKTFWARRLANAEVASFAKALGVAFSAA
jgi:tetratricopeptide (TPR) repeat protein